jgi:hypothetical protein
VNQNNLYFPILVLDQQGDKNNFTLVCIEMPLSGADLVTDLFIVNSVYNLHLKALKAITALGKYH